jgi:hypothetical protein
MKAPFSTTEVFVLGGGASVFNFLSLDDFNLKPPLPIAERIRPRPSEVSARMRRS